MHKKLLFFIIFLAVALCLIFLGWFLLPKKVINTPQPVSVVDPAYVATASAKLEQIEVNYTDKGFVPAKFTVKKGTVVVFYNKTKNPMVLSSKLPDFPQTQPVDVFAFPFNQTGTWSFQNEKRPLDQGTVTIIE